MNTTVNHRISESDQNRTLENLPDVDKSLEKLYKTTKRLQSHCITINTQPDISWASFMAVYRCSLDAPTDANIEKLLSEKNQQLQLREYTAEYLDTLSPNISRIFDEIEDFSESFNAYYEDFYRGIIEKITGSPDADYKVVIGELLGEIKDNQQKNKDRDTLLNVFTKKLEITYQLLVLLKTHAEIFFEEKREEIKCIETELSNLEATLDKEISKILDDAYTDKSEIVFPVISNTTKLKDLLLDNNTDENQDTQIEKKKDKLKEKIKDLEVQLNNYDSDYANLATILKACARFRSGIFSVIKDLRECNRTWNDLAICLQHIENYIDIARRDEINNKLLPYLNVINENFVEIKNTIVKIKKILPMQIEIGIENDCGEFIPNETVKINKSRLLNLYTKKTYLL